VLRHGEPSEPGHRAIWMPIATALDLLSIEGDRAFLRHAVKARGV
jgi:8-oxo-dGTP diphosphatase